MSCTGRYAEAWQFAAFWCHNSLLKRADTGVANDRTYLEDSQVDFEKGGVEANVGMILYNLTDGSSGPVTAVGQHTLTATLSGGAENLWDSGDSYRIVTIDAAEIAAIENFLDIAASDLHAAMAAQDMCDCTLAGWATTFLQKLNIIDAEVYYHCSCQTPSLSEESRQALLDWMTGQLELIRTGKIELCAGATGAEYPVLDWAEQSVTEFAAARVIWNDMQKS